VGLGSEPGYWAADRIVMVSPSGGHKDLAVPTALSKAGQKFTVTWQRSH
jgi:hypothetical protein